MKVFRAPSNLYHHYTLLTQLLPTGEGHFEGESNKPSGAATPMEVSESAAPGKRKGISKKAKTAKQRLAIADGSGI